MNKHTHTLHPWYSVQHKQLLASNRIFFALHCLYINYPRSQALKAILCSTTFVLTIVPFVVAVICMLFFTSLIVFFLSVFSEKCILDAFQWSKSDAIIHFIFDRFIYWDIIMIFSLIFRPFFIHSIECQIKNRLSTKEVEKPNFGNSE